MAARKPVTSQAGRAALRALEESPDDRTAQRIAVKWLLEELGRRAPGHAVEVRVPPFAAVQAIAGPRHTRGTPPAVVEMSAQTWLLLATGRLDWPEALESGAVRASGQRTDLSPLLPLIPPTTPCTVSAQVPEHATPTQESDGSPPLAQPASGPPVSATYEQPQSTTEPQ